jgi:predicted RNA-binding Zn-ribbon protein involved in translation (DUF1610 family)
VNVLLHHINNKSFVKRKYFLLTKCETITKNILKITNHYCKMECAYCGAEMLQDRKLEKTIIYKCKQCGLSDTRLKDTK